MKTSKYCHISMHTIASTICAQKLCDMNTDYWYQRQRHRFHISSEYCRCCCGQSRQTHTTIPGIEPGLSGDVWISQKHTRSHPTDAYGTIEFQGGAHPTKAQVAYSHRIYSWKKCGPAEIQRNSKRKCALDFCRPEADMTLYTGKLLRRNKADKKILLIFHWYSTFVYHTIPDQSY